MKPDGSSCQSAALDDPLSAAAEMERESSCPLKRRILAPAALTELHFSISPEQTECSR